MTNTITQTEIRHLRLQNSLLVNPANRTLSQTVDHLLGIQAQYGNAALLNLYNRIDNIAPQDFQTAVQASPIVKAWGNRQTLHLFTQHSWQEFVTIFGDRATWVTKHLRENNIDPKKAFDHFHTFGQAHPHFTRDELFAEFGEQAPILFTWSALLLDESMHGRLYLPAIAATNTSFTACSPVPQQSLLPTLQRYAIAYFTAYGSATLQDYAHFAGLSQTALHFTEMDLSSLATFEYAGKTYYGPTDNLPAKMPALIMLCKFDPLLIGYADKTWLTTKHQKKIWHTGGQIEPIILIDGDLYGTWRYQLTTKKLNATVEAYKIINKQRKRLIARRLAEYATIFGRALGKITYTGKAYGVKS
ncbi:DNA glycosylase AlkZ-like family protein [Furfurilactobacillus rossiae]